MASPTFPVPTAMERPADELSFGLDLQRHRVLRWLEKTGALPAQGPEDALQTYPAHSLQQRLRWTEVDVRLPP